MFKQFAMTRNSNNTMIRASVLAVAALAAGSSLLAPRTASAQILSNGSFETPVVGNGGIQYNPSGASWTFIANSGITGNNSGFTAGNPNAPVGNQVAFLQINGFFFQNFSGAGQYSLTFLAAQRSTGSVGGISPNTQDFSVSVDGTTIGTYTPASINYGLISTSFSVGAGTHTLLFQGLDTVGGDNTAFIDGVNLASISAPEPTSAAFVLTALPVAIGLIRRRRRA